MSERKKSDLWLGVETAAYASLCLLVSYLAGLIRGDRSSAQFIERLAGGWYLYVPLALAFGLLLALCMRWIWRGEWRRAPQK